MGPDAATSRPFSNDFVYHWIESPADLAARLARGSSLTRIGLDTEFVRERTFWPQLALVQIAIENGHDGTGGETSLGETILLIDPLAPGMAEALVPVLSDPSILKIMHSPSEDLVAFQRLVAPGSRPCS